MKSPRDLRVLLTEGSSLSAREGITALGMAGYRVDVCDPDPLCLGRFSRFVRRFHRCPPMGTEPIGFLDFVIELLRSGGYEVVLPTHEQAYLLAAARRRLPANAAVALASFASFERVQGKAAFSRLLTELGLPQPRTEIVSSSAELIACDLAPAFIKTSVGTASRGIWRIEQPSERRQVAGELDALGAFVDPVVVQAVSAGALERAQGVFSDGRLVAAHAYRQIAAGAGGGDVIKVSARRPLVRQHLTRLGETLRWHGALSVDYIVGEHDTPLYIDANPRLVEPVNGMLAGVNLAECLVDVSRGRISAWPESREGVRTHLGLPALIAAAEHGATRRDLLREAWALWRRSGPYAGSVEELTPLWADAGCIPAVMIGLLLALRQAGSSRPMSPAFASSHQLTLDTVTTIRRDIASA
jgi:predicted ATP-grasp superfamily ATP-dependent carboligase